MAQRKEDRKWRQRHQTFILLLVAFGRFADPSEESVLLVKAVSKYPNLHRLMV
jgi:hypothetical protein